MIDVGGSGPEVRQFHRGNAQHCCIEYMTDRRSLIGS